MLYRTMKKTGDSLSILGFGCMRLPEIKGKIDEERATKQLHDAIDSGVNYIDTAMPYHMGASEPFLGNALSNGYREKVKLATKLPPWSVKKTEDMDKLLNAQLDRLNTDCIDYYLVHALNRKYWDKMKGFGVTEFLDRAKKDGRIVNAGFSFHGDRDTFKEIIDAYNWDFCQIQYNYLDEELQAGTEGLEYAAAKDIGIIIMEPLRGGNLAIKPPADVKIIWDEADVKRAPVEWALRWIWNNPAVTVILSGMNDEEHIKENLRIADEAGPGSLSKKELELIDRVKIKYRELMKAGCTGCQYCMPCPSGVDIPLCFESYNKKHMFGQAKVAKMEYIIRTGGIITEDETFASKCIECGKCEELCPQELPIQELLKGVADEFESTGSKMFLMVAKRFMAFQRWSTLRKSRKSEKKANS